MCPGLLDLASVPLGGAGTHGGGTVLRDTMVLTIHVLQRAWPAGELCSGPCHASRSSPCLIPPFSHLPRWCSHRACSLLLSCSRLGFPLPFSPCFQARDISKCFTLKLRPRNLRPGCGKAAAAKFDLGKNISRIPRPAQRRTRDGKAAEESPLQSIPAFAGGSWGSPAGVGEHGGGHHVAREGTSWG